MSTDSFINGIQEPAIEKHGCIAAENIVFVMCHSGIKVCI